MFVKSQFRCFLDVCVRLCVLCVYDARCNHFAKDTITWVTRANSAVCVHNLVSDVRTGQSTLKAVRTFRTYQFAMYRPTVTELLPRGLAGHCSHLWSKLVLRGRAWQHALTLRHQSSRREASVQVLENVPSKSMHMQMYGCLHGCITWDSDQ